MIEPAVCVPMAISTWPAATAAAEPDEEPPGVRVRSRGLRVSAGTKVASSVVTVLTTMKVPASRMRATTMKSRAAGGAFSNRGSRNGLVIPRHR